MRLVETFLQGGTRNALEWGLLMNAGYSPDCEIFMKKTVDKAGTLVV
jgi:hypothetical protein